MKVKIEFNEIRDQTINYLSLGYITIEHLDLFVSNKDLVPNQAMMIFPTLADLMCGLHDLEMGNRKRFILNATGCSFELKFEIIKGETVRISEGGSRELICQLDSLARELWKAYENLFKQFDLDSLDDLGDLVSDLKFEALNFEVAFAYALKGI